MQIDRIIFAGLAILGAIVPMRHFLAWFQENGWSLAGMIEAWHANSATTGLVWDLTIAALALTIWIGIECLRWRVWRLLWVIPATFCIGVSCGLPLYFALRR